MTDGQDTGEGGFFDLAAIATALPASSATMLADHYLADRPSGSVRVFRVYRPVPAHYHETCDEVLYVLSGRGLFRMGEEPPRELGPGGLVIFPRGTVHGVPAILEEPFVFLSVDAPRRAPRDIVFVEPAAGSPETFMARNAGGPA